MSISPRLIQRSWLFVLLLAPVPALAYIDPNTGGMIFQIRAPILAIITSAWRFLRDRIRAIFSKVRRLVFPARASKPPPAAPSSDPN